MSVYGFFMPTVNLMGAGSLKEVGKRCKILGAKKALIVTDPDLPKVGIPGEVQEYLKEAGVQSVVFTDAHPNPTDKNVHDGYRVYVEERCDIIVSVGGGSSHDCAKGIGLVVGSGGKKNIRDFEGVDKSTDPMPPLVAVNTTSGTASEITRFCIITNTDTRVKMAIVDWRVTPNVSINDPVVMMKMPPSLTAATGMDALTHAVEAYVSTAATPVTDACALKAIELIFKYLRMAVANGDNFEAREGMTYAQLLAGMAFNNASLGYVHAMAHQLGGFYDLPHGVCNAILLPHVQRFNLTANPQRFVDMAVAMGEPVNGLSVRAAAERALDAIRLLSADIGIPAGLKELGVSEKDFEVMAKNAMKDACSFTNPAKARLDDIIKIFSNAM
ncbi:MAG: iron-containing alcohol dehydrogenase [Moorellaceae bacterium]